VQIIVNPAAGGGRSGREWPRLAEQVRALGLDAPVVFTRAPFHAAELAAEAVAAGAGTVVAVGGDGTACEVAEGLHRAGGGTLGFLPRGTGNDLARTLGIPVEPAAAVRTILGGETRAVDLIRVGEHVVLNAIGIGLTGDINRRAARIKVVRGIAVYLVTAVMSLIRFPSPRVRLVTPEVELDGTMTILAVHNGPTTGGGFALTPRAVPDDGLLDVCLVPGIGPLGRVPRLVAAMRGTLGGMNGTVELQAPWLELNFDVPLPAHLDGNQVELAPPVVRFELLPAALRVVAPANGHP
jgi:YegS/Rv2252/BmrU family lipid kinase